MLHVFRNERFVTIEIKNELYAQSHKINHLKKLKVQEKSAIKALLRGDVLRKKNGLPSGKSGYMPSGRQVPRRRRKHLPWTQTPGPLDTSRSSIVRPQTPISRIFHDSLEPYIVSLFTLAGKAHFL